MKFLIVAQEFPYPPHHGGRADILRRIAALHEAGHRIFLVAWSVDPIARENEAAVERFCEVVKIFPIQHGVRAYFDRLAQLPFRPSHIASRRLRGRALEALSSEAAEFSPDVILLDGLHGSWLARFLSWRLARPLAYRAHNVEHLYFQAQIAATSNIRQRAALTLASFGLKRIEQEVRREASAVFDISQDDMKFWRHAGLPEGLWLPPILSEAAAPPIEPDVDFAYVGNLWTPNNVEGVLWFLNECMPLMRAVRPTISGVIAGASPTSAIIAACDREGVNLIPSPASAEEILARGRALINPILRGSGLNVKSIDMLRSGRPVITTPVGLQGLPDSVKECFRVADNVEGFAQLVLDAVNGGFQPEPAARLAALEHFSATSMIRTFQRALAL